MAFNDMSDLERRAYANNKLIYENSYDKNSDEAVAANNRNQQFRSMYGIDSDDYTYTGFMNDVVNGGLRDSSNRFMKKIENTHYESPYKSQIRQDVDAIRNFRYDPTNDQNFKVYADANQRQSAAAQKQTISDLTALSGGRNNSWASAAVAQVGQAYAQKTADMIPQLADQAYNKLLQKYNLDKAMEQDDYNRWQNEWGANADMANQYYDRYNTERQNTFANENQRRVIRNDDLDYDEKKSMYGYNDWERNYNRDTFPIRNELEMQQMAETIIGMRLSNDEARIALQYYESGLQLDEAIKRAQIDSINADIASTNALRDQRLSKIGGGGSSNGARSTGGGTPVSNYNNNSGGNSGKTLDQILGGINENPYGMTDDEIRARQIARERYGI